MQNSDYNFGERMVHQFALGSKFIPKASFDFEELICGSKVVPSDGKHLFVSGLARSGTTALMYNLHDSGKYKSLTYLDMPFALMPNGWKRFNVRGSKSFEKKERAHGDGILVGKDSPEAFEEVFWRVFCERDYIFKNYLGVQVVNNETLKLFKKFVNHVILSRDTSEQIRYLSKNNNNILRLPSIYQAFPNSFVITTFRDPLQHAISLLNQHKRFSEVHVKDIFALKYMNWLGHFEFGLNHKPFYFGDNDSFDRMKKYLTDDINYWLLNWKNYYSYLLDNHTPNVLFFSFEKYCAEPNEVLAKLYELIDLDVMIKPVEKFYPKILSADNVDLNIKTECDIIYERLLEKSLM